MADHPLLTIAIIMAVGYLISLLLHPFTSCRSCKGRGRHWGGIYTYAFGDCRSCGGRGRKLRLGALMLQGVLHRDR